MYYMREISPLWLAYGEMKVLRKFKKDLKIGRKKEWSSERGHDLGKPSSLLLEEKDRSDLRIKYILTPGKANLSQGTAKWCSYRDRSSLSQWIPKGD